MSNVSWNGMFKWTGPISTVQATYLYLWCFSDWGSPSPVTEPRALPIIVDSAGYMMYRYICFIPDTPVLHEVYRHYH